MRGEKEIRESPSLAVSLEQELRRIREQMADLVFQVGTDQAIRFVSPSVKDLLGYESREILGRKVEEMASGGETDRLLAVIGGKVKEVRADISLRHREGRNIWLEILGRAVWEGREVVGAVFCGRDVTDRKKKEEELRISEERYRTILENIEDGYFEVDLKGDLTFASEPCLRMTGTSWEVLRGLNFKSYTPAQDWPRLLQNFRMVYTTGRPIKGFAWQVVRPDGTRVHIEASVSLLRDAEGRPTGFCGIVRDVTERKRAEDQLAWLAYHDPLTGLPNRVLFYDRAAVALAQAKRKDRALGVMMLDLDRFKEVNDRYGHAAGDRVLVAVAERLRNLFRGADTVARMGGDEFAVLLAETEGRAVDAVKERIVEAFASPFFLPEGDFTFSLSMGAALYPQDGADIDVLLRRADRAMYGFKVRSAKGQGP